ncbi:thiamine-monophosphate kinase [Desulfuromonas versatilis]|uniref:Thiamine-monophosphate kinase n=1 Tax=Desulfuromonas versatilis TaxID=2802975 RepID=A0ABN6E3H8_9BACT|nr:thiamine-phosphate kinase [Desulfuromonas versatilis]BCR06867.1 thiamine-monophosphate kinase [Desulfuromonas versatilis]
MKLSELGEFGFIRRLRQQVSDGPGVRLGIGDDCAALELPPGELLLTTTDLLIEQVHFRRDWTDPRSLGRKSVAVNISDIAAMGGTPRHLFLGLGIPAATEAEELEAFMAGFIEAAAEYGAALVGGDTCRSAGPLLISVTAQGSVPAEELVRRGGARPGDAIYVSGTLGDSALALDRLLAGAEPDPWLARRHHDPTARSGLGRALAAARLPSAMIDLSDGLLADLGHVLEASGVGARVELGLVPLSPAFRAALAAAPGLVELALAGGEDYELLFTLDPRHEPQLQRLAAEVGVPLTRVGRIVSPEEGLQILDLQGHPYRPTRLGFNHFQPGA